MSPFQPYLGPPRGVPFWLVLLFCGGYVLCQVGYAVLSALGK